MALIKHRPKLGLRAPSMLTPGLEARATVIVEAKRPVPVDAITVEIAGEERVIVGSGKHQVTYRHAVLALHAQLSAHGTIDPGRHELPFTFAVPDTAPATYAFGSGAVEYIATVRVDIDWWPDKVAKFILLVGQPKRPPAPAQPKVFSTSPDGPVGDELVLEASLTSTVIALGGTIDVAVGTTNSESTRLREVRVALTALETRFTPDRRNRGTHSPTKYEIRVSPNDLEQGVPLRIGIPDVPPTCHRRLSHLDWCLDVTGVVAFGPNVSMRIPLELVPEGGVQISDRVAPAPVGSSRQRAVWEDVARAHGMRFDGEGMSAQIGDVFVDMTLGHRDGGVMLVGEVRYPSLHIGLDGGPKKGFRRFLQKGVLVLGHDRFDHEYYMTGRDEGQVRAFVGGLGLSFFEMRLADATDTELSFVTKQRTRDALERMCQTLRSLAERVPVARAAIGPPQSLAAYVDTWRDVAQKTGATFEPARMALELTRGEDRAAVVTEWNSDGEAYRTTAALTVRDPIDEDYHFLSVERALRDDEAKKYGADARQLLGRLVADTPHVRVEAHALVAHLEPELEDPSNAMTVLKRLEALYALLRAAAGPYR